MLLNPYISPFPLFGPTKPDASKEAAKARLKFLLVHDHVDLTPIQLEAMKVEIMEVLQRYVEIDTDAGGGCMVRVGQVRFFGGGWRR